MRFKKAIIAAGSEPVAPGFIPADPRIWDSTSALEMSFIPKRMLVLGGGIIGLEMATVYHSLGAGITVIEMMDQLMPGADPDIVAPLAKRIGKLYDKILLKTKVTKVEAKGDGLHVSFEGPDGAKTEVFDAMLVSVGRRPNGKAIGAEAAGVAVDERGFIAVDRQMRTNVPHIFAIGDIVGQPMLAHKGTHEGKVAAEVASGHKSSFDAKVIPSVAYTDPEVAWAGPTETELKAKGVKFGKAVFPWAASGRSLSLGRDEGLTKTLWDEETQRLIGCGIVGPNAGDLISEAALAIEMGAEAEDVGLTIHPHPTLSETFAMSAEAFAGTLTDLYMPKKKAERRSAEVKRGARPVRVFFFGVGYCARRLIAREPWIEASGTARSAERVAALRAKGVDAYAFDGDHVDPGLERALKKAEAIVVSIPPRDGTGAAVERLTPPSTPRRTCGGSSIIRPSASMAITAAAGSTRRARR